MTASSLFPLSPRAGLDTRPFARIFRDALGLTNARTPLRVIEAALHAIRSAAPDHESTATTSAAPATSSAATGSINAEDTDGIEGDDGTESATPIDPDDPDAPRPKGPFDPGVVSMEELIREHSDAVYRVALSVTRDPILAEDVSQDALIKAWQALPSFRGDAPLRNWVLRITHNTAISTLRKRRDELREPDQLPERVVHGSVESAVQDRLALGRFEEALADLDELSRSIVVLREVEGLSYSELCDVLDLPMPTIKTRLLRARRQLAHALEGWQP